MSTPQRRHLHRPLKRYEVQKSQNEAYPGGALTGSVIRPGRDVLALDDRLQQTAGEKALAVEALQITGADCNIDAIQKCL